jgi:hypothetical protein
MSCANHAEAWNSVYEKGTRMKEAHSSLPQLLDLLGRVLS